MIKRYRNLLAIAAGAILVAALGISAHAQLSSGLGAFSGTAPHGSLTTIRSEHSEVASGAREPEQENDNPQQQAEPAEAPEAPEVDNDSNDNQQGEQNNDQHDSGGDSHDSGGDGSGD